MVLYASCTRVPDTRVEHKLHTHVYTRIHQLIRVSGECTHGVKAAVVGLRAGQVYAVVVTRGHYHCYYVISVC